MRNFTSAVLAFVLSACVGYHGRLGDGSQALVKEHDRLLRIASFQLDCPEGQLTVVDLRDHKAGVSGCHQRATYLHDDRAGWLRADVASQVSQ